ncbi:MAG: Uncharacterised protein [Rhodospirillaceae bacterium]|nr:MAG: Uncharacterised protein [Rhodospirillaceae bacterium]
MGEDHTVVTALFHRTQENLARILVGDLQAEGVDVEVTARSQIGDHKLDVAEPDGVESGVEIELR